MNKPLLQQKPKRFVKKKTTPFPIKGILLFFLPLAVVPATVKAFSHGNLWGIIVNAGGYGLFLLGAWLLRQGLVAEAKYHQEKVTRKPTPLKFLAAVLIALATGLVSWFGAGHSFFLAIAFGSGAFLGMYLTYGFDPNKDKMVAGNHGYTTEEVRQTLDEAEVSISSIEQSAREIKNLEFNKRIKNICEIAREILTMIEEDPGDIRRARKFLNIYLDGAQKVTEGYVKTHQQQPSQKLEQNFQTVLETIETVFSEQKENLLANDAFDLDVQMEVLATQLKKEGIL
ncbi:MAG: 5-bromo-4-chloroindolyl phosphate hydrolysis family protein [Methylococcales bacterium]